MAKAQEVKTIDAFELDLWDEGVEGEGLEDASAQDMMRPFLSILQANSPQCKRSEGAYIEDAHEGAMFNMATSALYDGSIDIVPVHFRKSWIEWTPRDQGGGFVAEHMSLEGLDVSQDDTWNLVTPAGNTIAETCGWTSILIKNEVPEPVIVSMTSTQLKKSRKLMSELKMLKVHYGDRMVNPPAWYSTFEVTTVPESNEHGSWMGWYFRRKGNTHEEYGLAIVEMAKELLSLSR